MMKRRKLSKKSNRKNFQKGNKVKSQNSGSRPMRGGWRL